MKAAHIKGMAKHILSDGKIPQPPDNDTDDLGQADSVHIERAGQGYLVRGTHPAKPPYRESEGPSGGAGQMNESKEVFQDHGEMLGHVAKLMGPHK